MAITTFKATAHLQEGTKVDVESRNFRVVVDEPAELGGTDTGMNPVELLLGALGACQAIVARVYAPRFGIELQDLWLELEGDLDVEAFIGKSDGRIGYSEIRVNVHVKADASQEKIEEFVQLIGQHCPVGDTISNPVKLVLNDIIKEDVELDKLAVA